MLVFFENCKSLGKLFFSVKFPVFSIIYKTIDNSLLLNKVPDKSILLTETTHKV